MRGVPAPLGADQECGTGEESGSRPPFIPVCSSVLLGQTWLLAGDVIPRDTR